MVTFTVDNKEVYCDYSQSIMIDSSADGAHLLREGKNNDICSKLNLLSLKSRLLVNHVMNFIKDYKYCNKNELSRDCDSLENQALINIIDALSQVNIKFEQEILSHNFTNSSFSSILLHTANLTNFAVFEPEIVKESFDTNYDLVIDSVAIFGSSFTIGSLFSYGIYQHKILNLDSSYFWPIILFSGVASSYFVNSTYKYLKYYHQAVNRIHSIQDRVEELYDNKLVIDQIIIDYADHL
ncbi:MAG: hypothetical protein AABY27_04945 [Pseudomonadota bacterium]